MVRVAEGAGGLEKCAARPLDLVRVRIRVRVKVKVKVVPKGEREGGHRRK